MLEYSARPGDEHFDLIVTVLTLHHIENTEAVLAGFAELLDEEDGSLHGDDFEGHRGFERSALNVDAVRS